MAIASINGIYQAAAPGPVPIKPSSKDSQTETTSKTQDLEAQRKVDKLKVIEQGVIAHERAHKGAGGAYAGGVSYTYTTGPDGKRYITGGEVSIDLSTAGSPEATVRKMRQIVGAALAPIDPSAQDYRVASQAQALELEAQLEVTSGAAPAGGASAGGAETKAAGKAEKTVAAPAATGAYATAGLMTDETASAASLSLYV